MRLTSVVKISYTSAFLRWVRVNLHFLYFLNDSIEVTSTFFLRRKYFIAVTFVKTWQSTISNTVGNCLFYKLVNS